MKVLIIYFSGTGNTLLVAKHLKKALVESGASVHLHSIEDGPIDIKSIESYDLIGFAFPIFGFGTQQMMMNYQKTLPRIKGKKAFVLQTGADFISINYAASYRFIQKIQAKGYNVFYDRIIAMGSNWLIGYDHGMVKQLEEASVGKTEHMAKEMIQGVRRRYRPNPLIRLNSYISALGEHYIGAKMFGFSLKVKDTCNHCNKCVESCPSKNIRAVNGRVEIGSNCSWCMRCIYQCPSKAIYSTSMNFCAVKDGYDLKAILAENKSPFVNEHSTGYFKHFWDYLKDDSM